MVSRKQLKEKYDVDLFKDFDYIDGKSCLTWSCIKHGNYLCSGRTLNDIENKLKELST